MPSQRWGDLLPLPIPPEPASTAGYGRSARRRGHRDARLTAGTAESVLALNVTAGFDDPGCFPTWPGNETQHHALKQISALHARRVWPAGGTVNPRAALAKTLRKGATDYEDVAAGTLCPYEQACVSLPSDQAVGMDLLDAVDPETEFCLKNFEQCMLKSPQELSQLYEDTEAFGNSYHDPSFDDPCGRALFANFLTVG